MGKLLDGVGIYAEMLKAEGSRHELLWLHTLECYLEHGDHPDRLETGRCRSDLEGAGCRSRSFGGVMIELTKTSVFEASADPLPRVQTESLPKHLVPRRFRTVTLFHIVPSTQLLVIFVHIPMKYKSAFWEERSQPLGDRGPQKCILTNVVMFH